MSGKNTFSSESTRNKMNAEGKTSQSGHVEAQVNIHWSMMNSLYIVETRRLNLISYGENF
jgi:hypothetical protein